MNHYEQQYDKKPLSGVGRVTAVPEEMRNRIKAAIVEGEPRNDAVNNPKHYTNHPSGIECIQVTEHMGFNLGNALKYIWRCDLKKNAIEDLEKAKWYLEREIAKRKGV
jgi:hypothetical protein